jgi:PAS domain S-box-containing protein
MGTEGTGGESAIRADDLQEIVVTVDDGRRVVHWNRAGADVTGLSRDSVVGSDIASLFDQESRPKLDGLVSLLGRGATVPGVELRLKTRYGHLVDVEVTGYVEGAQEGVGTVTLIMRDMTLHSLLEERRDRLERMFRTLVEHAPSMIYITDSAGHIEFINTAVERILGYAPRELKGRDLLELVHPDDRERAYWPVHERRTGARATAGFRVRFVQKEGAARSSDLQSVVCSLNSVGLYFTQPQGGGDPRFTGTEGIAADITEAEDLRRFRDDVGMLLPICSSCRRIKRSGPAGDTWSSLEEFLKGYAHASLSHTYCPDCLKKVKES